MIGSSQIDLEQIIKDVALTNKPMTLNKKYWDHIQEVNQNAEKLDFDKENDNTFWTKFITASAKDGKSIKGKARVRVDVVPVKQAETNPVAKARDEPNHSPHLPAPEGRFEFSLNPLKMFNQLVGPEMRNKIRNYLIMLLCIIMLIAIAPNVLGALIASCL